MKFTFVVNQAGVVDAGLLGRVSVADLCLLHYLRGWFNFDGAKIEVVDGRKFVWLRYEWAIKELPLLFNPQAKLTSHKNQLSGMIARLRRAGLVETTPVGRRLFFRLTDLAVRITKRYEGKTPATKYPARSITPPDDETVTSRHDKIIKSIRDEYLPTNIEETGTKEPNVKETSPLSPYEGEAESILSLWNSFPELLSAETITTNRNRKLRKRLADPFWREHWREGIERIAASDFAKGGGPQGWRANLDWFLRGDSLAKILEGQYDNRAQMPAGKASMFELQVQLKAVEARIKEHPASNENTGGFYGDVSREQIDEYKGLCRRRRELLRQIINNGQASRKVATGQGMSARLQEGATSREVAAKARDL